MAGPNRRGAIGAHGQRRVSIVVIRTGGDRLQEAPLSEVGGKRLFVKEIEDALLAGDIDLAVHSAKDMSAVLPDGLEIAAVLPREDPRDALVLRRAATAVRTLSSALAHIGGDAVDRHRQRPPHRAADAAPAAGARFTADSRQRRYAAAEAR